MSITRRQFVHLGAGALAASIVAQSSLSRVQDRQRTTCLAFDAFAILDPRPVADLVSELFPDKRVELLTTWRARQFEYTWLRSTAQQYADFMQVTDDALTYAARALKLDLNDEKRRQLTGAFMNLKAWPDAPDALRTLRAANLRLAFLSNFTPAMLEAGVKNSNLDGLFEHLLSTDAVKAFKPAPAAYQMAIDAFKVPKDQILFVPFAAWDLAGAKWFGYRTFWVNRQNQLPEELGTARPDRAGTTLSDLVKFLQVA